jgi:hypothetical protein
MQSYSALPMHAGDGHGTHVASIAVGRNVGIAKEANVVAVRVLDCEVHSITLHPGGLESFLRSSSHLTILCLRVVKKSLLLSAHSQRETDG